MDMDREGDGSMSFARCLKSTLTPKSGERIFLVQRRGTRMDMIIPDGSEWFAEVLDVVIDDSLGSKKGNGSKDKQSKKE
jgi:hypothetical protein